MNVAGVTTPRSTTERTMTSLPPSPAAVATSRNTRARRRGYTAAILAFEGPRPKLTHMPFQVAQRRSTAIARTFAVRANQTATRSTCRRVNTADSPTARLPAARPEPPPSGPTVTHRQLQKGADDRSPSDVVSKSTTTASPRLNTSSDAIYGTYGKSLFEHFTDRAAIVLRTESKFQQISDHRRSPTFEGVM